MWVGVCAARGKEATPAENAEVGRVRRARAAPLLRSHFLLRPRGTLQTHARTQSTPNNMDVDDDQAYGSEDEMEAQLMAQAIAASLQVRACAQCFSIGFLHFESRAPA